MKESYEKAYEEYKIMKNGTFDFKKYTENQGENKEEKEMKENKNFTIIQVFRIISSIVLLSVLIVRFLSEWCKWNVNISNETIGFAIVIALIFFFFHLSN